MNDISKPIMDYELSIVMIADLIFILISLISIVVVGICDNLITVLLNKIKEHKNGNIRIHRSNDNKNLKR